MRILVTGSDGFLGRAVMRRLRQRSDEVVPVTRRVPAAVGAMSCELSDPAALALMLRAVAPSVVVNLSATVDFTAGSLPRLYAVNALCPGVCAAYCATSAALLIQASTVAVHGLQTTRLAADVPVAPDTDYGQSKWLGEQNVRASGCDSAVIRFGGIFGNGGPSHLGINRSIGAARLGQRPVLIGSGRARRNYIYVDDAAAAIETAIDQRLTGVFYGAGETRSLRDMLQSICDVWLPGQSPEMKPGSEAADQVIAGSAELGAPRSFVGALEHAR